MSVPQVAVSNHDLVQEALLGEALEHAPIAAIVLDEQGRYLAANRMACELTGYSRNELLEGGAQALTFDPDSLPNALTRMVRGDLTAGTADMRCKDGRAITCEYRVGATRSGGLPFHVLVFWERLES
jgi:PAS domain S-box-containing protein